jgi:LmbE family N-acetylglucosaminyl deacetylase
VEGPLRVLVVAAHPDDAEFGAGGTIARWVDEGRHVSYLVLTSGDKGSHDLRVDPSELARRREAEQREAARRLGVLDVVFLGRPDGGLEPTMELRAAICLAIRQHRPSVVVTHDPWRLYQLHPDHRATGFATVDAIVAARDHLFFPEQVRDGIVHHRVRELYLFTTDHPNAWVDIAAAFDRKVAALRAHESQIGDRDDLAVRLRERAQQLGEPAGLALAEEFKRIELS